MSFNDILQIILTVMKDWRVIATIIAMLFFIVIANKIVTYKKRPRRRKKNKAAPAPKPAPKPKAEETSEEADEEEA